MPLPSATHPPPTSCLTLPTTAPVPTCPFWAGWYGAAGVANQHANLCLGHMERLQGRLANPAAGAAAQAGAGAGAEQAKQVQQQQAELAQQAKQLLERCSGFAAQVRPWLPDLLLAQLMVAHKENEGQLAVGADGAHPRCVGGLGCHGCMSAAAGAGERRVLHGAWCVVVCLCFIPMQLGGRQVPRWQRRRRTLGSLHL